MHPVKRKYKLKFRDKPWITFGIEKSVQEFLFPKSVCTIGPGEKSFDTVRFVKIIKKEEEKYFDEHGHYILEGD